MASDGRYMECLLGIDTKDGWEKSVTKVLSSFQELSFDIDPSMGLAYVKGKIDPHTVLKKLKKGGKHAMIHWVTYGPERDDHHLQPNQPYVPIPEFGYGYDPYNYYANDPYYGLYGPYSSWHNNNDHLLLNNTHRLRHGHSHHAVPSHRGERRISDHQNSPVQSSSLSSRPVTDQLVNNIQPASSVGFIKKFISIKKVAAGKLRSCLGLCYTKSMSSQNCPGKCQDFPDCDGYCKRNSYEISPQNYFCCCANAD